VGALSFLFLAIFFLSLWSYSYRHRVLGPISSWGPRSRAEGSPVISLIDLPIPMLLDHLPSERKVFSDQPCSRSMESEPCPPVLSLPPFTNPSNALQNRLRSQCCNPERIPSPTPKIAPTGFMVDDTIPIVDFRCNIGITLSIMYINSIFRWSSSNTTRHHF
jgi:hypothetical protein